MTKVDGRTLLGVTTSRAERKQRTRKALFEAALDLLADRGFASLSLREVTKRAGIVPTAFYRHFASMDDLGVALVDEAMRALRTMIRDARQNPETYDDAIRVSMQTLYEHVRGREGHFRFLVRERYSGTPRVSAAIATELRLFASELAIDLGRMDPLRAWSAEDLQMMAELIVTSSIEAVMELVAIDPPDPEADAEVMRRARKRLRLILLGVAGWRSEGQR
jgi:AcrR family transcriptional regulator